MSETTQGRRVEGIAQLERGGDYFPKLADDGSVEVLWFILPGSDSWGRIPALGHGTGGEPEWTITLEGDAVTVEPSIEQHAIPGHVAYWHGHLRAGVWTS